MMQLNAGFRKLFGGMVLSIATVSAVPLFAASPVEEIFAKRCEECHSAKTHTSGFSVATLDSVIQGGNKHGRAVVAGHPESSPLVRLLKGELTPRMPMGQELTGAEIARVEEWIRTLPPTTGATAKTGWNWPYQKPAKQEPPAVANASWVRNPIDNFVLGKLEAAGLQPAPAAPQRVLARRLYLDLLGVPPTPDELQLFLADQAPDAYEKLVDRLLADPRYGERWGRHWLDLARYAETSGLEGDGGIGNVWRYRDWVIDAFNSNMPYNRFVIQQLAGADEQSKTRNNYQPDKQSLIPTAFLRLAPWDRSNLVAADVRQNYLSEVTTATSSIFLGLTVGCARCHDHKYDPIPQRDFYRLEAFFQTTEANRNIEVPFKDKDLAAKAAANLKENGERLKNGPEKKELDAFEAELLRKLIDGKAAQAKGQEVTKADLRLEVKLAKPRLFTEQERQHYTDLLEDATRTGDAEEKQILEAVEAPMLVRLKEAYAKGGIDPAVRFQSLTVEDVRTEAAAKYSGKSIFTREDKARHGELSAKLDVFRRQMERWNSAVTCVTQVPGPPTGPDIAPVHVLARGDYRQPGEVVEPGFPRAITGNSEPAVIETDRYRQFPTRGWRHTLATWIASSDNPLTARVFVNRMWQHHFGYGIVRTPSDFGVNGDRPSHPELLDWLAVRFVESGWDIKAMHKLMLLSQTYRQASENAALAKNEKDPENRLLWHFNRQRLEAEAMRDSLLFVSGRLNLERGGPSVFPPLPNDLADFARYGRNGGLMWEPNENPDDARRRSVYIFQRRSLPLPILASFDALPFSESCDRRSVTTTPLQALSMLNGDLVNEESAYLAKRIEKEAGQNREAQIRRLFEIVLNRLPEAGELQTFARFDGTLGSLCKVMMNSNEFVYVD
jgi:mono/diheme cytochrome c family protein